MNLVKFQDVIIEGDDFFNEKLKGKYAYVINWLYIVLLDLQEKEYIQLSKEQAEIDLENHLKKLYDYRQYIDAEETEKINSVDHYRYLNQFTPDEDITIDEIKQFRTKVALLLKDFYDFHTPEQSQLIQMINFYANNGTDDVINMLLNTMSMYYPSIDVKNIHNSCGCGSNNNIITTANYNVNACDPVAVYTTSIYNIMVKYFSDIDFWTGKEGIIKEIIKYLENIIKLNLPLTAAQEQQIACSITSINLQEKYINALKNLVAAFNHIIDDEITTNKNFILSSLNFWAKELYNNMTW